MSAEQLMTPRELAAYFQVPEATVQQWRYKRVGPPSVRVGRHIRYRPAEVEAWLERQSTPAA